MKRLSFFFFIFAALFFPACKDSDDEGVSLIPASGKSGMIHEVILYQGDSTHDGNFGGRLGIDALCQSAINKPIEKPEARGFISIDAGDTIKNMPFNHYFPSEVPIKSKSGNIVADNWNDLTDGTIKNTLFILGVLPNSTQWWSGSDALAFGNLASSPDPEEHCNNFTNNGAANGQLGLSTLSDNYWMAGSAGSGVICSSLYNYLCIAY